VEPHVQATTFTVEVASATIRRTNGVMRRRPIPRRCETFDGGAPSNADLKLDEPQNGQRRS
jgi:hypothetical protein